MSNDVINYSQCWEDSDILQEALNVSKDDVVLSVTSGGDNTLALLARDPKKIVAIDINRTQNYLIELKLAAIQALTYPEFIKFIGMENSINRIPLFEKCKPFLTPESYEWWIKHQPLIKKGIIHIGKFEKFITGFRRYVLPFIHSKKTIKEFTALPSIQKQRVFYKRRWNSKRWNLYFRLSSHPFILNRFARQKEMSSQITTTKVTHNYLDRLEKNLYNLLLSENYFMLYCLTGEYGASFPPYLLEEHFNKIKSASKSTIDIETIDALGFLKSKKENTFTKYNLSDIFEALSQHDYEELWSEIIRTAKKGAIVAYWNNLITHPVPEQFKTLLKEEKELSVRLSAVDKVFFYEGFYVYTVIK